MNGLVRRDTDIKKILNSCIQIDGVYHLDLPNDDSSSQDNKPVTYWHACPKMGVPEASGPNKLKWSLTATSENNVTVPPTDLMG